MKVFNKELDLKRHASIAGAALAVVISAGLILEFLGRYNGSIALVFLVLLTGCILNKVYE